LPIRQPKTGAGLSEDGIIDLARSLKRPPGRFRAEVGSNQDLEVVRAVGDDAAVVRSQGRDWLWSCDHLVEGVHFRLAWQTPAELAWKLAAINLSDMAAMGGQGLLGLLSLALPEDLSPDWVEGFFQGLDRAGEKMGLAVIGGDTTGSPGPVMAGLAVWGTACGRGPVLRSGGRAGDVLLVSRPLGAPALALAMLEAGRTPPETIRSALLTPEPELELGPVLARTGLVEAMIDLSDGLARDAARLARESGLAAVLEPERIPVARGVARAAGEMGLDPAGLALYGGEEYGLLLACPARVEADLSAMVEEETGRGLIRVGRLEKGQGLYGRTGRTKEPLEQRWFEHFSGPPRPLGLGAWREEP